MSSAAVVQGNHLRPFFVTELLALIFSHLDDRSLSRAARVCRQWADVALDALWHTISDLKSLLGLLGPLTSEKKQTLHGTTSYLVCVLF